MLQTFGHGVFGVEDIKEVVVFFWYGFLEFCVPFWGRREVFLGSVAQGYFLDGSREMVITVQTPLGDAPL